MNILYLSIHPLTPVTHGGQIRQKAIFDHLTALRHNVLHIAITDENYTTTSPHTLILSHQTLAPYTLSPLALDLAIARYCQEATEPLEFVKKQLTAFTPHLLILEQPWLWPLAKRLNLSIPTIYSSQNVEFQTKASILENSHNSITQAIYELEKDLLSHAAACVAVTQSDLQTFKDLSSAPVYYLAPNGAAPKATSIQAYKALRSRYAHTKTIFFAASSYPPNAKGFWHHLGNLLWLPYEAKIVVAGSVCNNLFDYIPDPLYKEVAKEKIELLGFVDETTLQALYDLAHLLILPIHTGGGSNLKTAEAIAACKSIVATPFALRGYEWAKELDALAIAKNSQTFIQSTLKLLNAPPPITDANKRHKVFWYNCLRSFDELCKKLA